MKKNIIPYLAGVFTVLIFAAAYNTITQKRVNNRFNAWTQSNEEEVVSGIDDDAAMIAILKQVGPEAEERKNMTSSRWNEKRIVLTPNEEKQVIVDIELRNGTWSKIQLIDEKSNKQVTVELNKENSFQWTQIFGDKHMSVDKDFDGLIDLYAEWPPILPNKEKAKVWFVTDHGTIEGVLGEPFIEETTQKTYKLKWEHTQWVKEYNP